MPYTPLQLVDAFLKTGELPDALDALNDHLTQHPDDAASRRLRARLYDQLNQPEQALADLDQLPGNNSEDVILRSVLLVKLGRTAEALAALSEGHRVYPHDERLAERYLHLLLENDQLEQAASLVKQLITPESWRWAQWAGDVAVKQNHTADAITHYTHAIETIRAKHTIDRASTITGVYVRLLSARGAAHHHAGQLDQAEADYAAADHLVPGDPGLMFNRGLLHLSRGDAAKAEEQCKAALAKAGAGLRDQLLADAAQRYPDFHQQLVQQ